MRKRFAVIASASLAGCSLQPVHVRPALPTPQTYTGEQGPTTGSLQAGEIGWRSFFQDPRLQALIERALVNNRDLRVSVLRIDEARGQYRITRADRLPNVDLTGGATRTRSSGATGQGPSTTTNRFDIGAGVSSFELDFWGRVRSLTESARANYLSTVEAQRAFQIGLIADVAELYLNERDYDARIAIADRTDVSRVRALDIARLRLKAGVTSGLDYRQSEVLLTQAQTQLANLELQRALNGNQLDLLVGGPVISALPAPRALTEQGIVEAIAPGLPSDLLNNRPDILAAEEQLRAANADVGAARAAFLPRISLTGALGLASAALTSLIGGSAITASLGGNVSFPLFDAGRNKGNLQVARARYEIAVANYERTIQNAFREVSDGLVSRRYLSDRLDGQQRELEAQRVRANLATLRYRNGVASYLEVLDAERDLFAAEQQTVATRREQLTNAVDLYVALGGATTP